MLLATLKARFGFTSFRPLQREIIECVLSRRDVLVVLPMASGKSLCYTFPALVTGRTMLVVSPLLSLIEDQLEIARAQGVTAKHLEGGTGSGHELVKEALEGKLSLIYITPEKIAHWGENLQLLGKVSPFFLFVVIFWLGICDDDVVALIFLACAQCKIPPPLQPSLLSSHF